MKTMTRRMTWRCGFRNIEVVVQEDVRNRTGLARGVVMKQKCLERDPAQCDTRCLFCGGTVNPKNV